MAAMLLFGTFFLLVALSVPIGICLGMSALLYFVVEQVSVVSLVQRSVAGTNSFILVAIPFFVLAGNLMNTGGVTTRLYRFASALVGRLPGGLGHTNVVVSMIFSGMSGTAVGDAAGLGTIELKAMRDAGYDDDFNIGVTLGSAAIGPIIPPSNNFLIYAFLADVSVARMFLGGFVPGVLMGLSLMALVHVFAIRRKYPKAPRQSLLGVLTEAVRAIPPMLTPVILLGGIFAGFVTPTEAALLACLYAFFLGVCVYRDADRRGICLALYETVKVTAATMFIVAMASAFAWALAREQIPQVITAQILSVTDNKYIVLLFVNIILLIAGCFLDAASAMMILVPILLPIQLAFGIDPIHFGLVVVFNITLGNLTPPVGICLFAGASVAGMSLDRVVRATIPFLVPLFIVLGLITYVPQLVTLLPSLLD